MPQPAQGFRGPFLNFSPVGADLTISGRAAAEAAATAARVLDQIGQAGQETLRRQRIIAGERAGAEAALSATDNAGNPTLPEAEGVSDAELAFNRSARETFSQRIELTLRQTANQIAIRNRDDPTQMISDFDDFTGGLRQAVPADMRARFDAGSQVIVAPLVTAALDRQHEAFIRGQVATREQMSEMLSRGAATSGRLVAQGNNDALLDGLNHLRSFADGIFTQAGVDFPPGEAGQMLLEGSSNFSRRFIFGMFEGTADPNERERMHERLFLDGQFEMPLPRVFLDDAGNLVATAAVVNPLDVMSEDDLSLLRRDVAQLIDDDFDLEEGRRDRADADRDALIEERMARFSRDQNPADLEVIMLFGTAEQQAQAMAIRNRPPSELSGLQMRDFRRQIHDNPLDVPGVDELRASGASEDDIASLETEAAGLTDFMAQPAFRQSVALIDTSVGGVIPGLVTNPAALGRERTAAAAAFRAELLRTVADHVGAGQPLGRNTTGSGIVSRAVRNPDGSEREIVTLHPVAFVREQLDRFEALAAAQGEATAAIQERQNRAQTASREVDAAANSGGGEVVIIDENGNTITVIATFDESQRRRDIVDAIRREGRAARREGVIDLINQTFGGVR